MLWLYIFIIHFLYGRFLYQKFATCITLFNLCVFPPRTRYKEKKIYNDATHASFSPDPKLTYIVRSGKSTWIWRTGFWGRDREEGGVYWLDFLCCRFGAMQITCNYSLLPVCTSNPSSFKERMLKVKGRRTRFWGLRLKKKTYNWLWECI